MGLALSISIPIAAHWYMKKLPKPPPIKITIALDVQNPFVYICDGDVTPDGFIAQNGGHLRDEIDTLVKNDPFLALALTDIRENISVKNAYKYPDKSPRYHHKQDMFREKIADFVCNLLCAPR